MIKILLFSNFGYQTGAIGGQTIKVNHIYRLLNEKKTEECFDLSYFDTDSFNNKKIIPIHLFRFFWLLLKSTNIVFVGSRNNLLFFFPVIYFIAKLFNKQIDYIVVGGWLANFLVKYPRYEKLLASINGVYPQTKELCEKLENDFGFKNVYQLNNFRYTNAVEGKARQSDPNKLKLVYLARVSKQKGVGTLFKIANKIDELNISAVVHIYGPVDPEYQEEFDELLTYKPDAIRYMGLTSPDEVYSVLNNYDLMLFPTRHFTEGFPGSVLDAYISGMPVVASRWQYASEFIKDGETGLIADFENDEDFIQKTLLLLKNPDKLIHLTHNAKKESMKYSPEDAWKVLKNNMFKSE